MNFTSADNISLSLFVTLYLIVLFFTIKGMRRVTGYKKWLLGYLGLTLTLSLLAISGITEQFIIPIAPILFVSTIVFSVALSFSKYGKSLSSAHSFAALLGLQLFRFPLELILHDWSELNTIPKTMSWNGSNFDIIAGLICLITIPFLNKSRKLVWGVQIISFGLLVNVIRVAVLSSPFPFSWDLETPLLLIMYFPYALIVPGFVGVALACHLLVFRKLAGLR